MSRPTAPEGPGDPGSRSGKRRPGPGARHRPGTAGRREGTAGGRRRGAGRFPSREPGALRQRLAVLGMHPVLAATAIVTTLVVVAASLTAYAFYRNVYDSIHHETVTSQMLGPRPPKLNGALNVLVIGSDSRKGTHGKYGTGIYGSRSDTAMLLHISPTHQRALVISFPRDSMVPVYRCLPDGHGHMGQQAAPGQLERLNATFSYGGAPCLWKTLEQTTGIRIDHFVEVNFSGFRSIVNDVGGISVCLPFAINDPASGLHLKAGRHTVNGAQALAFVRERHVGLGSDLQRIERQQYFLASAMQKVKHTNILSDPSRIYAVVHDLARSLTTDSGLTLPTMVAIADSMKSLSASSVQFISVPVVPYPGDTQAEVQWAEPGSRKLFRAVAHDTHLPKAAKKSKKHRSTSKPAPTVSPSQVRLEVLNGSGTAGIAGTTSTQLASRGFTVTGTGDAPAFTYTDSVIEYALPSQLPAVTTLKAQIPGAQVKQVSSLQPGGTLSLILGSSFSGLSTPTAKPKPSASRSLASISRNYGGISGNTNICHDQGAFSGPDNPSMFAP